MKHLKTIKLVPMFKCQHCGSSNVKININGTTIDPKKPNILKISNELKKINSCFWECFGRCEDETSAKMTIGDKIYEDPEDVLKYLTGNNISNKITIKKAIEIGDVNTIKEYITSGNDVNSYIRDTPEFGMNPRLLNSQGIDTDGGYTLLGYSVKNVKINIVEYLINSGCDVNKKYQNDITPLYEIIGLLTGNGRQKIERTKILDILLENGADPYLTTNGMNCLERILYWPFSPWLKCNKTNCENFGYRQKLYSYILDKITNKN